MKTVFVNVEKCVGCRHCEIACAVEHSHTRSLFSALGEDMQPRPRISVGLGVDFLTFPNRCRHCNPAPCMQICPTNAISMDQETGSVLINADRCISCGMCAMVCPFSVIGFHKMPDADGVAAGKCDNCIDRQREGKVPACVDACKTGALLFGEINEIAAVSRQDVVMKVTRDFKGGEVSEIPPNIVLFQGIREKIARIGPLPSSD